MDATVFVVFMRFVGDVGMGVNLFRGLFSFFFFLCKIKGPCIFTQSLLRILYIYIQLFVSLLHVCSNELSL